MEPVTNRPNVADQTDDPGSLLNTVRRLIALRRDHPALGGLGDFAPVHAEPGSPFVYRCQLHGREMLVAVNPAAGPARVELAGVETVQPPEVVYGAGDFKRSAGGWVLHLPGVAGGIYRIGP